MERPNCEAGGKVELKEFNQLAQTWVTYQTEVASETVGQKKTFSVFTRVAGQNGVKLGDFELETLKHDDGNCGEDCGCPEPIDPADCTEECTAASECDIQLKLSWTWKTDQYKMVLDNGRKYTLDCEGNQTQYEFDDTDYELQGAVVDETGYRTIGVENCGVLEREEILFVSAETEVRIDPFLILQAWCTRCCKEQGEVPPEPE